MTRARLKPWILWLLPLMLLRAVVPMGFMLSNDGGTLTFTFCSSIASPSASDVHAAHHHDAHGGHHQHHGSEAHERSLCPYGLTGTVQVASLVAFESTHPIRERSVAVKDSRPPSLAPSQTEPIRGPPTLA